MTETTPSGPSAIAQWQTMQTGAVRQWRPLSVIMLPDSAETIYHALLETPMLWRDASQGPVFSLTLVLERPPLPSETDMRALVTGGFLAFDMTLSVPVEVRESLEACAGYRLRPIFARQAHIKLTSSRGGMRHTLASAELSGTALRAGLTSPLNREEAIEVLDALDCKEASSLRLSGEVVFRAASADAGITISGYWAEVYDFLAARTDEHGELTRAALEKAFDEMLRKHVIDVSFGESASGSNLSSIESPPLLAGFLRVSGLLLAATQSDSYRLRQRPHPVMRFEYRDTSPSNTLRSLTFDHPLDKVMCGALEGNNRDLYIRRICPDTHNGGSYGPAPRNVQVRSSRGPEMSRTNLSAAEGSIKSVALTMRPSLGALSASSLVSSDLAQPHIASTGRLSESKYWLLDDLILDRPGLIRLRNLPIVNRPDEPLWRDRVDPNRYWFAPAFTAMRPQPNADPASSPFLFTYRRTGATVEGRPALRASIRITLRADMTAAQQRTLSAIAGARATPVPLGSLSIKLSVPYIDEQDGKLHRTSYQAAVVQSGNTITATFELINDAVRLAYGALAVPGFQSEAARLEIVYSYEAYVPFRTEDAEVVAGGKISVMPIAHTQFQSSKLVGRAHVNAESASLDFGAGEIKLRREVPRSRDALAPPVDESFVSRGPGMMTTSAGLTSVGAFSPAISTVAAGTTTVAMPIQTTQVSTVHTSPVLQPSVILARPQISVSEAIAEIIKKVEYATRTLVRQETIDVLLPCENLGSFYREESDSGTAAIGCADALRLGQTVVRQYGEMPELEHEQYRVFRSLGQPGRFLVLPTTYRITRYSPSVPGKAYRPAVAVYSSLDVTNPANNRVIYHATLQPDIAPNLRRALMDRLRLEARDPIIEYPTETTARVEYAWTVGSSIRVEPQVVKAPDSFQVTLATDLAGALLLRSMVQTVGVFGSARFTLPDGTIFETNLAFELNTITGPWTTGPVELTLAGPSATIRNAIERPIDVSELLVYDLAGRSQRVPVEASLPPNATRTVTISTGLIEAYAVCTVGGTAGDIEEIRSFIEDIHTNVVFINLINFGNHDLARVSIEAQIKAVPGAREVPMSGDPPRGSVDFLLPLTTYLTNHVLQFRVTKVLNSGSSQTTPWLEWDLEMNGNVVSLTWELIR